jgi:hypothetical protein
MHDHDRHPVFEYVVFGTALVLFCVLMFYGWQRFGPKRPAAASSYYRTEGATDGDSQPDVEVSPPAEGVSDTVRAVGRIPPVEGTPGKPKKRR